MLLLLIASCTPGVDDSRPLVTQDLVDRINSNPDSTFKAALHPRFARMTVGEAKKFLSPVTKIPSGHGSARPIGASEKEYARVETRYLAGLWERPKDLTSPIPVPQDEGRTYRYAVYDNSRLCSSWAPAVTSAMSLAISRWSRHWLNLSLQFVLDCDILADPCMERPPLHAYWSFWRYWVPQTNRWDRPANPLRPPHPNVTTDLCDTPSGCYPGWSNCPRNLVMTGSCASGGNAEHCPIYYLYNWRWMKSHLYEVGPITSSVLVRPGFFAYESGVYSAFGAANTDREGSLSNVVDGTLGAILGLLDVTIIGWGQQQTNLSTKVSPKALYNRWWYVIPHMGTDFGENCTDIFGARFETADETASIECPGGENGQSGLMRWARRVDDSNIESRAVGAVPYNFSPLTELTPKPTGKKPYG